MPSFTTTVKDSSPLLAYSDNWRAGVSEHDAFLDQYTESSFTLAEDVGENMTFKFYGSFIEIAGAKRQNHGTYQVQVDDQTSPPLSGFSTDEQFNVTLFNQTLELRQHTVVFTNLGTGGGRFVDIDYVAFRSSIGEDDEPLIVNTFPDSHPSFTFSPPSSWGDPDSLGSFSGGSGRATFNPAASATFSFQGDTVALYGPVGPLYSALYSVQVDNQTKDIFSARKQFYRPQQILFFAANLGPGTHSLLIHPERDGVFAIDFANVYTTPSLGGSFFSSPVSGGSSATGYTQPTQSMPEVTSSRIPKGAIAGLCITSLIACISTVGFLYLLWVQRRQRRREAAVLNRGTEPYPFTTSPPAMLHTGFTVTRVPSLPISVQRTSDSGNRPSTSSGPSSANFDPTLLTSRRHREIPRPPSSSIEGRLALPASTVPTTSVSPSNLPSSGLMSNGPPAPRKLTLRLHSSMLPDFEEPEEVMPDSRPASSSTHIRRSGRHSLDLTR